jgi:aldose 1-epimerase
MNPITLRSGDLRLVVLPELGGGIARFDLVRSAGPVPVFRSWDGISADPNALGCYVLVPFSNRISGGGIEAGGRFWPISPNLSGEPFPIHGSGWQRPWTVVDARDDAVALTLEGDDPAPFAYRAHLTYELIGRRLRAGLEVTHLGDLALPYGLGLHPWLPRTPLTTLQAACDAVWLETPEHLPDRCVPIAERPEWDFSLARALPPSWINNGLVGWDGRARIRWPERGLGLDIEASAALGTCIVYSPGAEADFFCFEPVSHAVDAFHLPGGPEAHGLRILEPGDEMAITCLFEVVQGD